MDLAGAATERSGRKASGSRSLITAKASRHKTDCPRGPSQREVRRQQSADSATNTTTQTCSGQDQHVGSQPRCRPQ